MDYKRSEAGLCPPLALLAAMVLEQPQPAETAPVFNQGFSVEFTVSAQNNMIVLLKPPAEGLWGETFSRWDWIPVL